MLAGSLLKLRSGPDCLRALLMPETFFILRMEIHFSCRNSVLTYEGVPSPTKSCARSTDFRNGMEERRTGPFF